MLLAKREKEIPFSPIFVIMKLNEVWFRTLLNIQDTKLNLKILISDKVDSILLYLISELSTVSKY